MLAALDADQESGQRDAQGAAENAALENIDAEQAVGLARESFGLAMVEAASRTVGALLPAALLALELLVRTWAALSGSAPGVLAAESARIAAKALERAPVCRRPVGW